MTSPAELNAARLSQQLEINRQKLAVKSLQQQARTGARWSNIRDDWNKSDESVKLTRKTLTNLNAQNEGLKNQPGYVSTKVKFTQNISETTVLINDLDVVRSTTQRTENISVVTNNLPRDSAGTIVKNEQIGSVENSRFTTPITGNNQFFNDTTQEVKPVVASLNKNTNARLSSLSGLEDQALGDVKGSGTTSTVGGSTPVVKLNQTQNQNNLSSGESLKRSTDDDSTTVVSNSVGTASQVVEGRAEVAAEFMQTIKPAPNKLAGLASQTYTISIYLMNQEEYKQLLGTDKKTLPTDQLLMQSGGAPVGKRNRFFDLDFFIENLEFTAKIGYQGTQSPHNVLTMDFEVLEPNGITLLERLRQAVWEHTGDRTQTINGQNYLMVIRFFGYDDLGNLVSNAPGQAPKPEQTSDPNALVEKFIPFQIAQIDYKISSEAVQYNIKCTIPQTMIGYSTARGTIPFNFQLSAIDVQTLLNGDTQLQKAQAQILDTDDDEALEVAERAPPAKKVGLKGATITQGLATALNEHQQALAVKTPGYIPDRYSIELENVAGLKDAKMRKQGTQNKRRAPLQDNPDVNQKLNQKKQNYDTNTKNYSINAGTQIVQLIDQVMKNSTYITAQQSIAFDEVTKKQIKNPPVRTVQWYKISQIATPIGYDPIRQDYAYDIKYFVTRYQINTPRSPYFPPAMYRGVHKLYNYWFTGQNTEVINFEIQSSSNYVTPINNSGIVNEPVSTFNARFAEKRFFQTSADESTQGGEGESTLPAAQLASRLYTRADVARCDIDIVGDPDFIAQSELFYTSSNLAPFEKDGSANFQASEVLFEVRFNRPADYDMPTGLTPVYQNNTGQSAITGESNLPEESLVFTAIMVKSIFKQGKFTQTIQGTIRDFNTAVDSPEQKKAESNIVEEQPGLDAFGGAGETVRPTKKPAVPVGTRPPDAIGPIAPTGVNRPPDYISGAGRPSGLKPTVNQGSKISPYTSPTVNNATTRRIAESGINGDVDYTGSTIDTDTDNWQPPVQPKPGSNTVSDDAGTNNGFRGSLLKKKTQRALERSKRRVKAGATVVGGGGAGTNSSAFR
jgi:hypothetical protein